MPRGLKQNSELITVSSGVQETAPNTFTQLTVPLALNPLDQEVFVVQSINIDHNGPDAIGGVNTGVSVSVTTTPQTQVQTIASPQCLATGNTDFRGAGLVDSVAVVTRSAGETPATTMEYLAIIATNDFSIQIEGSQNINPLSAFVRVYGFRARADSGIYSALVQSELLS